MSEAAFYCVCDSRYFLGAVAMLNSLRVLGHREPLYVLDCGLTPAQREIFGPHVTLVPGPSDVPPYMLKTIAPLRHPSPTMVLIDTDVIVTRPLTDLIETAAGGRVVGFRNFSNRFFPEWGSLLDLGTARRRPYISVSLVLLGGELGSEVMRLLDDRQRRIDFDDSLYGRNLAGYPFTYPEQDVLNAIIATRQEAEPLVAINSRGEVVPPFEGLSVVDAMSLRCADQDGTEPYFLHHFMDHKPWLEATEPGVYSTLLTRLLVADDVAVRVPERQVPLRLREGWAAALERKRIQAVQRFRWHVSEPLSARIRGLRAPAGRRATTSGD
ncbi:MAG: hypothetical protein ACRDK1_06590 [Solirubrobacterales bacterium]